MSFFSSSLPYVLFRINGSSYLAVARCCLLVVGEGAGAVVSLALSLLDCFFVDLSLFLVTSANKVSGVSLSLFLLLLPLSSSFFVPLLSYPLCRIIII